MLPILARKRHFPGRILTILTRILIILTELRSGEGRMAAILPRMGPIPGRIASFLARMGDFPARTAGFPGRREDPRAAAGASLR